MMSAERPYIPLQTLGYDAGLRDKAMPVGHLGTGER